MKNKLKNIHLEAFKGVISRKITYKGQWLGEYQVKHMFIRLYLSHKKENFNCLQLVLKNEKCLLMVLTISLYQQEKCNGL